MMRVLTASDIRRCLSMQEAIAVVREAFRRLSTGQAIVPPRTHIALAAGDSLFMPGWIDGFNALAVKVVSVRMGNPARGLPTVPAAVLLFHADTGTPRALLDGTILTRLRTGAAVGAATDLLARKDASVLAMIGAGALSPFCVEAVRAVREIAEARVYSRTRERVEGWVRAQPRELAGLRVNIAASPGEAVQGADVIVCATTSSTPVFEGTDLKTGAHVNGVGSYRPEMQEVDEWTVQLARVVVDSRESCMKEAGDLIVPIQRGTITAGHVHAELGDIVAGAKPGRENDNEITFFKSVGNAVQDVAVAAAVVEKAEQLSLGHVVEL